MHQAILGSMKEDESTVKVNPLSAQRSELSKTTPILRKAVLEDIAVSRYAYLEIIHPGLETTRVELEEEDTFIGRGSLCRVQLQFDNTSRLHARITFRDEEYQIEDLESTNGTFVNGVQVQKCVLRNNDQIQIGDAKILFIEGKIRKER
ncbi:MAG: FHA domain-containing protein [Deltaproteobacteria bacterium]|nr:FHA domain-containing protein [Deltaproteobacteria bacterium]MBW2116655.1 FHA domain-containing protein [Deltaproteobacteria bacterium]MBW2343236.1 FHA domain-containing protein [Deltaproteobacteria bacterium]